MNLVSWSPFRDLEGIFDRYSPTFMNMESTLKGKDLDWRPTADISETKKHYLIKAELPEVEKEDVHVAVIDGMLTISGERRFERDEETETQHRVERMYGKFSRCFNLPPNIDESAISAETKNGILKVRIPKTRQTEPKPVQIAVK